MAIIRLRETAPQFMTLKQEITQLEEQLETVRMRLQDEREHNRLFIFGQNHSPLELKSGRRDFSIT